MTKLKKPMIKNLAIMFYIHNIFVDFVDKYNSVNLSNIFEQLKNISDNIDKPICSNNIGELNILNNTIYLKLFKNKISGNYQIKDCGYVKFFDIVITEDYLKKNKIPNYDSFLAHTDNIKHICKIIKILSDSSGFKTKSNGFGSSSGLGVSNKLDIEQINWSGLIENFLPEILQGIHDKNDIFNFDSNKKFCFYIKVYSSYTKAFIIDKKTKLIYYINSIENHSKPNGYLFYYVFELDSNYNIQTHSIEDIKNKLNTNVKNIYEQTQLENFKDINLSFNEPDINVKDINLSFNEPDTNLNNKSYDVSSVLSVSSVSSDSSINNISIKINS
jgi:hypothetical protein